jgi:hypothetical protein
LSGWCGGAPLLCVNADLVADQDTMEVVAGLVGERSQQGSQVRVTVCHLCLRYPSSGDELR